MQQTLVGALLKRHHTAFEFCGKSMSGCADKYGKIAIYGPVNVLVQFVLHGPSEIFHDLWVR